MQDSLFENPQFLAKLNDLNPDQKSLLLKYSSQYGQTPLVKGLMNEEAIAPYLGRFTKEASLAGHRDVVELLMMNKKINADDISRSMENAVQNGHREVVEVLLKHPLTTDEMVTKAARSSVENNQLEFIELFMKDSRISMKEMGLKLREELRLARDQDSIDRKRKTVEILLKYDKVRAQLSLLEKGVLIRNWNLKVD